MIFFPFLGEQEKNVEQYESKGTNFNNKNNNELIWRNVSTSQEEWELEKMETRRVERKKQTYIPTERKKAMEKMFCSFN